MGFRVWGFRVEGLGFSLNPPNPNGILGVWGLGVWGFRGLGLRGLGFRSLGVLGVGMFLF